LSIYCTTAGLLVITPESNYWWWSIWYKCGYSRAFYRWELDVIKIEQDTVLSQGVPRDAAANFGTYRSFQRHRAVFTASLR